MRKLILFAVTSLFLSSCQFKSLKERKIDSIKSFLTSKIENTSEIEIIETSQADFLYNGIRDSVVIAQYLNVLHDAHEMQKSIDNFKMCVTDEKKRIWLKTMPRNQKNAYQKIQLQYDKAYRTYVDLVDLLGKPRIYSANVDTTALIAKYYIKGETHIGFFYFHNQLDLSTITGNILLTKDQIEDFSNITKHYIKLKYESPIPNLEDYGFDIVPEDEDPTKTKEERAEIKRKKAEEREKFANQVRDELEKIINQINESAPIPLDDVTVLHEMEYSRWSGGVITYYVLLVNRSDYSDYQWEAMKSFIKGGVVKRCSEMSRRIVASHKSKTELKELLNSIGLFWRYVYKDIKGNILFTIEITPSDL